jgi:DNA integrity scanning protein DisA with diadenylate cyclase activity
MAACTRGGRCGVSLTRHGDILIFREGSLLWTYRFGRWQMWNHSALCRLLTNLIRGQRTSPQTSGKLARAVYRASLDAAFRRHGALFVVLNAKQHLKRVAARDDCIDHRPEESTERVFDKALGELVLQSMPRSTLTELASLDGAVITERNGRILAYGAVMRPRKMGCIKRTEGSRTKAAIGASNYGTAVKVSSDGQISIYFQGAEFLTLG